MSEAVAAGSSQSVPPISLRRRVTDHVMTGVAVLTVVLVLAPLIAIFGYLVYRGVGSINWAFLTQTPKPVGEPGGGMANAIIGSVFILGIASIIGVPVGVGAGIYLAEFGRNRFGSIIRFTSDVLNGVPSIVIGIVGYSIVVLYQKHFSALAGGVALAIMMVPTICRTTEEMLLLVPQALREAAYGLGVPRWRTTLSITLRTATSGVITGIMLAFARVAGETAPLLFTAFGNQFWNLHYDQPTAALPLQIFVYAISPYDEWHRQAWAGALVLIVLIVGAVAAVRYVVRRGIVWNGITYGRWNPGRKPECLVRQRPGAVRHQSQGRSEPRHGADWTVGVREVDIHSLHQSHARDDSRSARRRPRPYRRDRRLQRNVAHTVAPSGRDGVSETESVSDDVDLRQRCVRAEAQRISRSAQTG